MLQERRKNSRVSLYCMVTIEGKNGPRAVSATLADLSLGGCFINCASMPQMGEQFSLSFDALGQPVRASAVVRWLEPGVGFGCQFMRLDLRSSQNLHGIVSRLRGTPMPLPELPVFAED